MDRIYPTPTIFIDDSEPDLNAENLNKITNGLSTLDKRVAVDLLSTSLAVTVTGEKAVDATVAKVLNDKITQINSDLVTLNSYETTPSNTGVRLYYRRLGPCKSIYTAGTHTVEWTAGTTYGLATVGGIYAPSYSWSKRIPYKTSGNVHFATLSMDTAGQLTITPETVGTGGTLRIHEIYF